MRSVKKLKIGEKSTTYEIKYHKGDIGDLAFEWDFDGSEQEAWNQKVKEWKEDGSYGQEETLNVTLHNLPEFDNPPKPIITPNSYRMIILDFSKYNNK